MLATNPRFARRLGDIAARLLQRVRAVGATAFIERLNQAGGSLPSQPVML